MYAAGFIDGEGCVWITERKNCYYPRIDVGTSIKAKSALDMLQKHYGGPLRKAGPAKGTRAEQWDWNIQGPGAAALLRKILPYLQLKQEQARLCLVLWDLIQKLPPSTNKKGGAWSPEDRSKGRALRQMVQELNRKGPQTEPKPGWFARLVGDYCLTPQPDMFSDLGYTQFCETWPEAGTWDSDGYLYELRTSGRAISGNEFSSWPNWWPTARREDRESAGNHPGATDSLTGATRNWATPRTITGDAESAERKQELGREESGGGDLQSQVQSFFPTPAQRDYRTPGKLPTKERRGNSSGANLENFVAHNWPTPNSNPTGPNNSTTRENGRIAARNTDQCLESRAHSLQDQMTQDGPASSESGPTSRRRLNPQFVEWLMGFPPGWTEL